MNPFLTLLEHLCSLAAGMASVANPAFAPVISIAASGINAELAHIAAGNKPTLASAVENVMPGSLALGAALVARNNPKHADLIAETVQEVVSVITTPSSHQDAVLAAPLPSAAPAAPVAPAPAAPSPSGTPPVAQKPSISQE